MEIGKVLIDFEVIPTNNPTRIIVGDMSRWSVAENQASLILITPPGSQTPITKTFQKDKLNNFNSINLGLSPLDSEYRNLPDGVWKINVKSTFTGLEKTRFHLKADVFLLALDSLYIRTGLEFDKNNRVFREDLQDIEFLLRSAAAHTRNGDKFKAERDFSQAQQLLSNYANCKDCI